MRLYTWGTSHSVEKVLAPLPASEKWCNISSFVLVRCTAWCFHDDWQLTSSAIFTSMAFIFCPISGDWTKRRCRCLRNCKHTVVVPFFPILFHSPSSKTWDRGGVGEASIVLPCAPVVSEANGGCFSFVNCGVTVCLLMFDPFFPSTKQYERWAWSVLIC